MAPAGHLQSFFPPLDPVVVPWGNSPYPAGGILEGCIPVTGPVSVDRFEMSTVGLEHQKELGCLELFFLWEHRKWVCSGLNGNQEWV